MFICCMHIFIVRTNTWKNILRKLIVESALVDIENKHRLFAEQYKNLKFEIKENMNKLDL